MIETKAIEATYSNVTSVFTDEDIARAKAATDRKGVGEKHSRSEKAVRQKEATKHVRKVS